MTTGTAGANDDRRSLLGELTGERSAPGSDLRDRTIAALVACYQATGSLPTAGRYKQWRAALPDEQRKVAPSMTAVVPIAFPDWATARSASGLPAETVRPAARGPQPGWTVQECIEWVRRWDAETGGGSLANFDAWLAERRRAGEHAPAASTIRLRLRLPWSGIQEMALNDKTEHADPHPNGSGQSEASATGPPGVVVGWAP